MSTLTVGTYNERTYSIHIRQYTFDCRPADFNADVLVADQDGNIIDSFEQDGDEDWQLRNACIKRIMTGDYS